MLRATSWTVSFLGIGTPLSCRRRRVILAMLALAVHRITNVVGVLTPKFGEAKLFVLAPPADPWRQRAVDPLALGANLRRHGQYHLLPDGLSFKIGRASCRERVEVLGGTVSLKITQQ